MPKIDIHYEKNPQFRTVYADGLIGGTTPAGMVNLNFYATRNIIPRCVSHDVADNGMLINPGRNSDDSKEGIIREIEVGVYMSRESARDVYTFLKTMFKDDL